MIGQSPSAYQNSDCENCIANANDEDGLTWSTVSWLFPFITIRFCITVHTSAAIYPNYWQAKIPNGLFLVCCFGRYGQIFFFYISFQSSDVHALVQCELRSQP